jgi:metaxin
VAKRLYVLPTSSNILVRTIISRQLQSAAEAELLKNTPVIDINDLYGEADKAFEALSILLGQAEWFFGGDAPTLFDASVFAYTHLLLHETMRWKEKRLVRTVRKRANLVEHRNRLLVRYFGQYQ